jgi:putative transposase
MLANRIEIYEKYKGNKEELKIQKPKLYTSYKHEYKWLYEVDNQALANAQMNLNRAYSKFFKEKTGFPKFKIKKDRKDSYTTNNNGNKIHIKDNKIRLPKIGYVNINMHREFHGIIKSCIISRSKTNKYYVSILVKQDDYSISPAKNKIGIDLGLTHFAITTNDIGISEKFNPPKYLMKMDQKLRKSDRSISRKKLGSKNREKARLKHAKLHEKVVNQRKDFLHKLSHKIVSENQVIAIETVGIKDMMRNHKLAKHIQDASWFEFVQMLEYKSRWNGREIIKANRYYPSSQICSECGHRDGKKSLKIREWTCGECGTHHDRDINASKNLLNLII